MGTQKIRPDGRRPFLRIPPFPGARASRLAPMADGRPDAADHTELVDLVGGARVGGTYWAAQPELPVSFLLVRSAGLVPLARQKAGSEPVILWPAQATDPGPAEFATSIRGDCDPWHMLERASALVCHEDDDLRVIAAIADVPAFIPEGGQLRPDQQSPAELLAGALGSAGSYACPFTGRPLSIAEVVELCGFWRRLIDSNRDLAGGLGFAFWKQASVEPLLWGGSRRFRFLRSMPRDAGQGALAVWRARVSPKVLAAIDKSGADVVEVEDGFLRSKGLGADCVPPLSITVDRLGAYFDPGQPSELENVLQQGALDDRLIVRARRLRELIVAEGLGKYEGGFTVLDRPGGDRRHLLVTGQVEDDRSVLTGGSGLNSNLALLERARQQAPDAFIIYKPHPDVVAGHRKGAIPERDALRFADRIAVDAPISSLIGIADEVHVNTSLAGFEALLRVKTVVTHGVPFYAGWGLTRDLGPVPPRRTARRSLDELVAATLLVYPRYLDPVSGLPCPAEIAVARLTARELPAAGPVVRMRRLQGRLKQGLRSLLP